MQFAKDSFYVALRERLRALNPQRVIERGGMIRPAIVVVENELPAGARLPDTYYIEWGDATVVGRNGRCVLMRLECFIWYQTRGDSESGVDRGRKLGQLDRELSSICMPAYADKRDYSQTPSTALGTGLFWSGPNLEAAKATERKDTNNATIERWAKIALYFYPEVN